ncbi:MAG TPA: SIMPL domain-containing protein [Verrucomicrobiae bacterium]|nr:SIMPL domain-containing protein [Verrucomicrobiae bacterium]
MKNTLALLAIILATTMSAAQAATVTHISVSGEGTVALVPDEATVRASVVTNADSAESAVSQNNTIYAHLVDAAVATGVARDDMTLAYYNISYNPRPKVAPGEVAPTGQFGYVVSRSFDVKVRSVAKTGAVVDALTKAGVTNVENVSFGVADSSHALGLATSRAMADARSKADEIARAAGLHIIGIEQIASGGAIRTPVPMMKTMAMSVPAAPTVFDSGNVNVVADLAVVFLAQP